MKKAFSSDESKEPLRVIFAKGQNIYYADYIGKSMVMEPKLLSDLYSHIKVAVEENNRMRVQIVKNGMSRVQLASVINAFSGEEKQSSKDGKRHPRIR